MSNQSSVSAAEHFLYDQLLRVKPSLQKQFSLSYIRGGSKRTYRYDFRFENKIIEFHGDFWHANPLLYAADFVNPKTKRSSTEIWTRDYYKNQHAIDSGYSLIIVWESDFNLNKQEVIDRCTRFLIS